jgi:hypothetical protein
MSINIDLSLDQLNGSGKKSRICSLSELIGTWLACFDPRNFEGFDDRERGIIIGPVISKKRSCHA